MVLARRALASCITAGLVLLLGAAGSQAAGWKPMSLGPGSLKAAWGSGPDDVYGVGGYGSILHYDGSSWSQVTSGTSESLSGVWGSSPSDVFAVGARGTILHYDGSSWTPMSSGTTADLRGVWGLSPANVFAVGTRGVILRYDGSAWAPMASGTVTDLNEIWGASPTEIYVAGSTVLGGEILRYDGSGWTSEHADLWVRFFGIWGFPAGEVFAVGSGGTILRREGSSWTPMASPTASELWAVWGSSPRDVYAAGAGGLLLHYDGTAWTAVPSPTTWWLYAVWGTPADTVYAMGERGTILRRDAAGWTSLGLFPMLHGVWGSSPVNVFTVGSEGAILRYDGSAWLPMASGTKNRLRGVWGASPTAVFAVGDLGTILRYNGSAWTAMASGTTRDLNGVWGTAPGDVFAVGDAGTILHFDGSAWAPMASATTKDLHGIWGTPSRIAYAFGNNGQIQRFTGSVWYSFASAYPGCTNVNWTLHAGWGFSPTDVFFAGDEGKILHFTGSSLDFMDNSEQQQLWGLWGPAPDNVYALEWFTIRRYDGRSWTTMLMPDIHGSGLRGIWGFSASDIFIVGSERTILRYSTVNEAPTGLALNFGHIHEHLRAGTSAGSFSTTDPDSDSFTYTLVDGAGDDDNGAFRIVGSTLTTAAPFDYETRATYAIRVRTTDPDGLFFEKEFTVTVLDVNEPPTEITLAGGSVAENQPPGTSVGTFTATSPDGGTPTFSFVVGTGAADNGSFEISGNVLRTRAAFDHETKSTRSIRVIAQDVGGSIERVFVITVGNLNEPPTGLALSGATVEEGRPAGALVGTLSATDPDAGESFAFAAAAGDGDDDNGAFEVTGSEVRSAMVFDRAARSTYTIRLLVADSGGLPFERSFTVTVTDANDAPQLSAIGNRQVEEGSLVSFRVLATDADGDPVTLSAQDLPPGALFDAGTGDFSWTPGYGDSGNWTMAFRATDSRHLWDEEAVVITVFDPVGPVFVDDFADGAAPTDWRTVSGSWSASGGVFGTTSTTRNNLTTIVPLDPAALPLGAGVVQAKVKLTASSGRSGPNAMILFAYQDAAHYRYVKVTGTQLIIGQTGTFAGVAGGAKKKALASQPLSRFTLYTVRILPNGWVSVYKGSATKPAVSHRFTQDDVPRGVPSVVLGGVGLAAQKARTIFDRVTVWDDSAL